MLCSQEKPDCSAACTNVKFIVQAAIPKRVRVCVCYSYRNLATEHESLMQKYLHLLQIVETEKTVAKQLRQQIEDGEIEIERLKSEVSPRQCKQIHNIIQVRTNFDTTVAQPQLNLNTTQRNHLNDKITGFTWRTCREICFEIILFKFKSWLIIMQFRYFSVCKNNPGGLTKMLTMQSGSIQIKKNLSQIQNQIFNIQTFKLFSSSEIFPRSSPGLLDSSGRDSTDVSLVLFLLPDPILKSAPCVTRQQIERKFGIVPATQPKELFRFILLIFISHNSGFIYMLKAVNRD